MENLNIRVDDGVKKKAEVIFGSMGLTMSSAINLFLRQSIRDNSIPFIIKGEQPNEKTLEAFDEAEKISKDNSKGCKSIKSLKDSL